MATHSSILAWEIPGTEEPGGLRFMRSQKSQTQLRDLKKKLSPCSVLGPEQDVLCELFTLSQNINSINLGHRTLWLSCSSEGKESACNAGGPGFHPWVGKIPWRRAWQLTPVFLPGESHGF